jgi:hypothetical protein
MTLRLRLGLKMMRLLAALASATLILKVLNLILIYVLVRKPLQSRAICSLPLTPRARYKPGNKHYSLFSRWHGPLRVTVSVTTVAILLLCYTY